MRPRDAKDSGEGTMLDPNLARPRLKEGLVPPDTGMFLRVESGEGAGSVFTLSAGGTRLPITKSYRAIKTVRLDLFDGGSAVSVKIVDRDPDLGPLVQAFDASLAGTAATVNATVEGY